MVTRINGFSSGMDIDTLVKQLMQAQRIPLDKIVQKKQTLEWQRDSYRDVNKTILEFKNTAFNMKLQGPYLTKNTSSTDESVITAKATANATNGVYKLRVDQLAESASAHSTGAVTTVPGGDTVVVTDSIADVDATVAANFSLIIGGEKGTSKIELKNTDSIASFMASFNKTSSLTGVRVTFDDSMKRFFFVSATTGEESKIELNSTDANFLNNVLKVDGVTNQTGESVTGSVGFMTTPPDELALDKLIDSTLTSSQTLRIGYGGNNYEVGINSSTTIGGLINSLNDDVAFKKTGIKVGLDPTTGALTFTKPNATEAIKFTDMSVDGSDIVSQLGLPVVATTDKTVTGAAYVTPVPPFVDTTKVINSGLTENQTFRIKYDVDGDLTTEDYDFTISSTTTIGSLMMSINNSDLGKKGSVNVKLDEVTGNLVFSTPDNTKHFDFSDATVDGADVLSSLGLTSGVNDTAGAGDYAYSQLKETGKNAIIQYNSVIAEYSSNTFSINGVNFTAKEATGADVNIVVSQDVDAIYDSVKGFIDQYNAMISIVNDKLAETKYRAYQPLTDDEKEALSDDQVTAWELKAKSGLLKNDGILSTAMNRFRSNLVDSVKGLSSNDYSHLSEIGISTGSYLEKGKLHINESELRAAISNNPEQVMQLFITDDNDDTRSDTDGLATRLHELSTGLISRISEKAGSASSSNDSFSMGKALNDIDNRILRFEDRLISIEDRYFKQFTAMETAMARLSSQSASLLQQFGGS